MSILPIGATKRVLVECNALAQQLGAAHFGMLISGYLDLLQDQHPRLMVLSPYCDASASEIVTSIEKVLLDWKIFQTPDNAPEPGNPNPFCDFGIVLTRATNPFREEEASLLRSNWRRAFHWSVLLTHASDIDEEDLEDAQSFAHRAFSALAGDLRQLSYIWNDVHDCVESLAEQSAKLQERSMLCLSDIRDTSITLQERLESQKTALAAEILRLSGGLSEKQQEYRSLSGVMAELQQKLQSDLTGAQSNAYLDLGKLMSDVRKEVKAYIQNAPIGQLEQSLEAFLETKADKVFRTVSTQAENAFDAAVTLASEALYAARCKYGISNRERSIVSQSLSVSRQIPAGMDSSQMISTTPSDDMTLLQANIGLGLLAATINPVLGIAVGLYGYFTRQKDRNQRQDTALRGALTSRVLTYLQEFNYSFENELKRALPTTITEIVKNVKHLCQGTLCGVDDAHAIEFDQRHIAGLQAKQARLVDESENLARLLQSMDREIDRQDLMRHMEERF